VRLPFVVSLNDDGMALVAADCAHAAARTSGDATILAAAARSIVIALRRLGHHDCAIALLTRTALSLGADTGAAGRVRVAAVHRRLRQRPGGNRTAALDLVDEAEQAAVRLGERRSGSGVFGPANVAVYRIGIHTALGEPGVALTHARAVDQRLLPVRERHARSRMVVDQFSTFRSLVPVLPVSLWGVSDPLAPAGGSVRRPGSGPRLRRDRGGPMTVMVEDPGQCAGASGGVRRPGDYRFYGPNLLMSLKQIGQRRSQRISHQGERVLGSRGEAERLYLGD